MGVLRRLGPRRDRRAALLVLGGLVTFVAGVYTVVVVVGGALIGRTSSPHLGLSVLATAIVALAFEPARERLGRLAARVVQEGRRSPYDVLSRFSEAVAGSSPADDVPARMAKVLAEGTGARWTQVWLVLGDDPVAGGQLAAGASAVLRTRPRTGALGGATASTVPRRAGGLPHPSGTARRRDVGHAAAAGARPAAPDPDGGAAVRRPGRAGGPGAAQRPPADRAGPPAGRALGTRRRAAAVPGAAGGHPGRRASTTRARHP